MKYRPKDPKVQGMEDMVEMTVLVPRQMRDALRTVWKARGITISQQVRTSLTLWLVRVAKNPEGVDMMIATSMMRVLRGEPQGDIPYAHDGSAGLDGPMPRFVTPKAPKARKGHQSYNAGHDPNYDPDKDPEPVRTFGEDGVCTSPGHVKAAWFSWSKRRGDYTAARLAEGMEPTQWAATPKPEAKPKPEPEPEPEPGPEPTT